MARKTKPLPRLIDSEEALAAGIAALARLDPDIHGLIEGGAKPFLRRREPGLAGLAWIIVSQQLSTASAAAIWARLSTALPDLSAATLAAATDDTFRAVGMSAPKIRTLRAIAAAVADGTLQLDGLHALGADEAHAAMVAVKGIGPWTANIYLLTCLGHPDAFPAGDLALQEAARLAFSLDRRPSEKELTEFAERWRPWRSIAARVLWAHYRIAKSREGAPV